MKRRLKHVSVIALTALLGVNAVAVASSLESLERTYADRLLALKRIYDTEVDKIDSEFRRDRLAMPQKHIQAMRDLEQAYQSAGDLESYLAVERERKRFTANPSAASINVVSRPAQLGALQQTYIGMSDRMQKDRDRRVEALTQQYEQALNKEKVQHLGALSDLKRELTIRGEISEAKKVLNRIKRLERQKGAPDPSEFVDPVPTGGGSDGGGNDPHIDVSRLRGQLNGKVVRWDPASRKIELFYAFDDAKELLDWQGGTYDRKLRTMVTSRTVTWLRPQLESVERVEGDIAFRGDDETGMMFIGDVDGLTVKLATERNVSTLTIYQSSAEQPITKEHAEFKQLIGNHVSLDLSSNSGLRWSLNDGAEQRHRLEGPIRYPTYLGFGSMQAVSAYDNVRVVGTLSAKYVEYLLSQAP